MGQYYLWKVDKGAFRLLDKVPDSFPKSPTDAARDYFEKNPTSQNAIAVSWEDFHYSDKKLQKESGTKQVFRVFAPDTKITTTTKEVK